jgi:hypothetical protein
MPELEVLISSVYPVSQSLASSERFRDNDLHYRQQSGIADEGGSSAGEVARAREQLDRLKAKKAAFQEDMEEHGLPEPLGIWYGSPMLTTKTGTGVRRSLQRYSPELADRVIEHLVEGDSLGAASRA